MERMITPYGTSVYVDKKEVERLKKLGYRVFKEKKGKEKVKSEE